MQIRIKKIILHKISAISCSLWLLLKIGSVPIFILSFAVAVPAFARQAPQAEARHIRVHLQDAYDAGVSVIRFDGARADYADPVAEVSGVKTGQTAVLTVPGQYLPGEFVLRLDYRLKEADHPYPSERIIFIHDQDVELNVNPPYINNDLKTKFNEGEKENTVYAAFMKENMGWRQPVEALRQFLLSYDQPGSAVSKEAEKAFEQRRREYNTWLKEQTREHAGLFVSRLFQFHYIPPVDWSGDSRARVKDMLEHYFDGIDFSDPLIVRSRELARFMDAYMRLYGMRSESREEREALFIKAGREICEAVSHGHPDVYQWAADYLRRGYDSEGVSAGIDFLEDCAVQMSVAK